MKRVISYFACLLSCALASSKVHGDAPVFHLDFSALEDVSGSGMEIEVGEAVALVGGGGPLLSGTQLDSGSWDGTLDNSNQILVLDNATLDGVSTSSGSIVAWIKPVNGDVWNSIVKTPCEDNLEPCDAFSEFRGIELQTSGLHAGVFGSVQGWNTNVFSPQSPLRTGGATDTPSGVWTHTALTWNDNGDHTVFVNSEVGESIAGVGEDAFGLNDTGDWTIGGDGLNPTRYLHGELADVAIFDFELTLGDVELINTFGVAAFATPCNPDTLGDLDTNGNVDFGDFLVLSEHFGQNVPSHVQGDVDCNGTVDFADFLAFSDNFGASTEFAQAVPEPATGCLALLGGLLCLRLRRRR